MKQIYFTPGPSEVYFTLQDHIRSAIKSGIPSISHRGGRFSALYQETVQILKQLMNIPDDYYIFFTSSATEVWERMIQNCVERKSLHLVNGAFSRRFSDIAQSLGIEAIKCEAKLGSGIAPNQIDHDPKVELLAITHNETSTGVAQPLEHIAILRQKFPKAIVSVDMVSSAPYVALDFNQVDAAYFSVQKCFGLPAGLGVWILNQRCIEKAKEKQSRGQMIGSYHSLPAYLEKYKKFQTPETPNVLAIYLLGRVAQDLLNRGLDVIRKETEFKSGLLYYYFQQSNLFAPFVKEKEWRSKTVIVADCLKPSEQVIAFLKEKGFTVGGGYGAMKSKQIRIANFPTHSKEQVQGLVDQLSLLE
ncbi:MAG: aminotransferase class V-fold PLP-dependent enzyme [Cyclobacteriaceae bacterium]